MHLLITTGHILRLSLQRCYLLPSAHLILLNQPISACLTVILPPKAIVAEYVPMRRYYGAWVA